MISIKGNTILNEMTEAARAAFHKNKTASNENDFERYLLTKFKITFLSMHWGEEDESYIRDNWDKRIDSIR
jgi:hypothetical protein